VLYDGNKLSDRHCQHYATHCNTPQHTATHCNTLQHTATHTLQHTTSTHRAAARDDDAHSRWKALYHGTQLSDRHCQHCNTLQRTATHCNRQPATDYNTLQQTAPRHVMMTRTAGGKRFMTAISSLCASSDRQCQSSNITTAREAGTCVL